MHLEPGGSEDSSSLPSLDVPTPQRARGVPKADLEPGAVPRRDGLPKAYRMRHGRHYVEQLMGDAPLRTIRDVAVTEFHEPPDTGADLTALQASIKDHGMLEPLVVAPDEGRYRIIGGAKRFRAALAAGLQTLPCIVHDLHGHSFEVLRLAAQRAVALEPERQAAPAARVAQTAPPQGQRAFAALDAAVDEALRLAVLTDLVNVERHRAEVMAAAEGVLGTEASAVRGEVVADSILEGVIERIRTEARLRNVTVAASVQNRDYRVAADPRLVSLAIECMSRSMLALCCGSATNVRISVEGTDLRPALIVRVSQDSILVDGASAAGFFDRGEGHPGGATAALMAACVLRVARLHGGRADVEPLPPRGCTMTLVVPRFGRH